MVCAFTTCLETKVMSYIFLSRVWHDGICVIPTWILIICSSEVLWSYCELWIPAYWTKGRYMLESCEPQCFPNSTNSQSCASAFLHKDTSFNLHCWLAHIGLAAKRSTPGAWRKRPWHSIFFDKHVTALFVLLNAPDHFRTALGEHCQQWNYH